MAFAAVGSDLDQGRKQKRVRFPEDPVQGISAPYPSENTVSAQYQYTGAARPSASRLATTKNSTHYRKESASYAPDPAEQCCDTTYRHTQSQPACGKGSAATTAAAANTSTTDLKAQTTSAPDAEEQCNGADMTETRLQTAQVQQTAARNTAASDTISTTYWKESTTRAPEQEDQCCNRQTDPQTAYDFSGNTFQHFITGRTRSARNATNSNSAGREPTTQALDQVGQSFTVADRKTDSNHSKEGEPIAVRTRAASWAAGTSGTSRKKANARSASEVWGGPADVKKVRGDRHQEQPSAAQDAEMVDAPVSNRTRRR